AASCCRSILETARCGHMSKLPFPVKQPEHRRVDRSVPVPLRPDVGVSRITFVQSLARSAYGIFVCTLNAYPLTRLIVIFNMLLRDGGNVRRGFIYIYAYAQANLQPNLCPCHCVADCPRRRARINGRPRSGGGDAQGISG